MRTNKKAVYIVCSIAAAIMMSVSAFAQAASTKDTSQDGDSDILVAYFSRAGENWEVGFVEKGNTEIVAEIIAEKLGADLFKIETVMDYPESYDEMLEIATEQRNEGTRPEIKELPENLDKYSTVFLGYPIWWGGLPMPIYTFLENQDFTGKVIYPFNTHGGSGVAGTDTEIAEIIPDAEVKDGFAVSGKTAQNEPEAVEKQIEEYLEKLGF